MNKIDLNKAKIGDKFRTRNGEVVTYKGTDGRIAKSRSDYYVCFCSDDVKITYFKNGSLILHEGHPYDLVEQVFDDEKGRAITDKILKDVEKVTNGVAEAMPLIESATIANLPREPLPENNEDDAELQRRQEVVELADRIFFSERCSAYSFKDCIEVAEHSVNMINQYLKEGKL